MADFYNFESSDAPPPSNGFEDDPAAEFLAREQDQLAELENDNFADNFNIQSGNDDFTDHQAFEDFTSEPQSNGPTDLYSAVAHIDQQRQEPEKLRIWREEQTLRLAKKDEEEAKKNEEWKKQAKKELEDWYKHHDEQNAKAKENNLIAEAAFIKERDENMPGQQWEKVCRLCEFNPKNSKNTKDVSRLRSILLQLKQTPLVR